MKKCLLVSGGEFAPVKNINEYDFVIACDKGYEHCKRMGIQPDLVIGDLDSYEGTIDKDIELMKLNPIKDDTDTMSAVRYALEKGYTNITICCAFGGRFDHSMANIQTAAFIIENGGTPKILGKGTKVFCIKNTSITLRKEENCYLSVFSVSDKSSGVTIQGAKYNVSDIEITNTFPLGVSNEWVDDSAFIEVKQGLLLIVISENVKIS